MIDVNFKNQYTVKLEEDQFGDLILPFPEEMLKELGWDIGDTLVFKDLENGSFEIKKSQ